MNTIILLALLSAFCCRGCWGSQGGKYPWINDGSRGRMGKVSLHQTRDPNHRGLMPRPCATKDLVPKEQPGGNRVCFSCKLDFRKLQYQWDHPCLGRHNNFNVSEDFLVTCGPNYNRCKVERMEVNGVLIMLKRECTDKCYNSCRLRGFGINYELCEKCCDSDGCNHVYPSSHATQNVVKWHLLGVVILLLFT